MTGASIALRELPGRTAVAPVPAAAGGRRALKEVAVFAGLGAMCLASWSRLVTEPPAGRIVLCLAITCLLALALTALGAAGLRRPLSSLAGLAIAVAGVAATLLAAGVEARLLVPGNWSELEAGLSFGFAGVEQTELPYRGGDEWLRLALLIVAPAAVALLAALAFWPGPRRQRRRMVALVALIACYAVAATLDSPGAELVWGVALLALAAAWLWTPRFAGGRSATALASVAVAGVLALPIAASLDPETPWWDYESWSWFGAEREVTFDWDHSYGPLEWPQRGTALLEIESSEPLYWKASVLDRFDGFTWQRPRESDIYAVNELDARGLAPGATLPARHPGWLAEAQIEVRALSSPFVIGAGQTQEIQGLAGAEPRADGTVPKFGQSLQAGDEYSVFAYAPDPTAAQLRRAPAGYPPRMRSQVLLGLPAAGVPTAVSAAGTELALGNLEPVVGQPMALWGTDDDAARAAVEGSAYADVYRLSRRLVAGARTPYDAVIAIQRHLHRNYVYNPDVSRAPYALRSFLFDQREGYCQQFAGSMALMLRMVGIPTRVVSGFAPGTLDPDSNRYVVHDTDAHSWVEVFFRGIGWVTFDPTPAAAPAVSQSLNELAAFRGVDSARPQDVRDGRRQDEPSEDRQPAAAAAEEGGLPWRTVAGGLALAAAIALAVVGGAAVRRRRALAVGGCGEAQLDELLQALRRLGWGLPPQATLLALERRFAAAGRPAVAGYAASLRAHRFAPGRQPAPDAAARRALRKTLSTGGGVARRVRGWLAIPPGGPRRLEPDRKGDVER